jgi:hypothetical protein
MWAHLIDFPATEVTQIDLPPLNSDCDEKVLPYFYHSIDVNQNSTGSNKKRIRKTDRRLQIIIKGSESYTLYGR